MPHPSDVLPKEVFVLDGSNALVPSNGKFIYAIMNPTASAMEVYITTTAQLQLDISRLHPQPQTLSQCLQELLSMAGSRLARQNQQICFAT
jgi:hypothetical protein